MPTSTVQILCLTMLCLNYILVGCPWHRFRILLRHSNNNFNNNNNTDHGLFRFSTLQTGFQQKDNKKRIRTKKNVWQNEKVRIEKKEMRCYTESMNEKLYFTFGNLKNRKKN